MNDDIVYGWHFLQEDGVAWGGYRPPAVGVWEPPIDNPSPCVRGYHGSPTVLKALTYAAGPILGRCEYRGVVYGVCGDKWAARERRCIARVDASAWLRFAACRFAEEAMLAAGVADERATSAVRVARDFALGLASAQALAAARDAAWDAACAAARDAARDGARDAAWDAAWAATRDAARDAAWAATRDAQEAWMEAAALDLDSAPTWEAKP